MPGLIRGTFYLLYTNQKINLIYNILNLSAFSLNNCRSISFSLPFINLLDISFKTNPNIINKPLTKS